MTSDAGSAFVWVWLPGYVEPVVAGRLDRFGSGFDFTYGKSYLARDDAIALYLPELPLEPGRIRPRVGEVAGCIADAAPDAWGRRVILGRELGSAASDTARLDLLTYLLKSGSDRSGALDFQVSATDYVPRHDGGATLEELVESAERVESGIPLSDELDAALLHGSSIGGARPKASLRDAGRGLIAKFGSSTDHYPVVKGEFLAMELARRAGLDVAQVELTVALGRDVLLVERFDRTAQGGRRAMVSALTVLGLDEWGARYASYEDLAGQVRARFTDPRATLRELFGRLTFNILSGNTDDHARNHSAFWDGRELTLTPAYDICPTPRSGGEATQAMLIGNDGFRFSQVAGCVERAGAWLLSEREAREIVDHQIEVINHQFRDASDQAGLSEVDREFFWKRQFLNPFALYGY